MDALDKQAKELQIAGDRRSAGWRMCRMGYVVRIYRRFGFWLGDIVFNGIFMGWSCQQYHLKRFFRSNFDQSDTGRYSFIRFSVLVRIDEVPLSVIIDLLIGNRLSEGFSEKFKSFYTELLHLARCPTSDPEGCGWHDEARSDQLAPPGPVGSSELRLEWEALNIGIWLTMAPNLKFHEMSMGPRWSKNVQEAKNP